MRTSINIGPATVMYNAEINGWMLPGNTYTTSPDIAFRACETMNDYMQGVIRGGTKIIGILNPKKNH